MAGALPTAAAWTFASLPNAISFALIGVVLAEFVGSTTGMGYLMITALATLNATDMFASVTLPVSVNPRGTTLNQVYMGVFRPDPDAAPRWKGNVKQYQLAVNTSTNSIFLADQTGSPWKARRPASSSTTRRASGRRPRRSGASSRPATRLRPRTRPTARWWRRAAPRRGSASSIRCPTRPRRRRARATPAPQDV